ncbi:MAG: ATP-binding protein [Spirochaetota bacterium]
MQSDRHGIDREEIRRIARLAADSGETPDVSALSDEDVAHLIYEFGVYQNELLAQNEQLEEMRSELEASHDELGALYEFAPIGYVTLDSEANVVKANLTVCQMLETQRSQLVGHSLLKWIAPEKHHEIRTLLRSTTATADGETLEAPVQLSSHGTPKHLRLDIRPEHGERPQAEHCLVALTDITEQKHLEAELIEARQAAETNSAAKSTFLANVSHEIRTPMNGILGMLQILEQRQQDAESQEYISAAKSSAETLLTIISDVLDLSKIEAGKLEAKSESVSLRPLIEDVRKLFEHRSAQTSIPLRVDVDQDIPDRIVGDGVRIRQVLFNLVGNAFKFTDEGEIRLEVQTQEGPESGVREIVFTVVDTGVGMSPDLLENVLQPFVQANAHRTEKAEGTGLGLAIADRLVELMGGNLSLHSEPGTGTRATFTVPCREDTESLHAEGEADAHLEQATETYRLLVAEDNAINSLVMTTMLQRLGHETRVARDGLEVLKLLEAEHFDAVLMDIQMPNMDGVECTKRIRNGESRAPKDIPIIALTAYAMEADKAGFRNAGVDAQLTKPIYFEALQRELPRMVSRHRKA